MSNDVTQANVRSVDSVAAIYAIVIGLALSEAIHTLISTESNTGPSLDFPRIIQGIPAFVALMVTMVPFWHGMNRHLDRCYITKPEADSVVHKALLFDFFTFFIEAALLFVAGTSLRIGYVTFYCLGLLLVVDMIWGFISHIIHFKTKKSHLVRWSAINVAAGFVGAFVFAAPFQGRIWLLMILSIMRTIMDYWLCSKFYFPDASSGETVSVPASAVAR